MATLHANRSACLYNMKLYHESVQDVSTSLSLPYPENLHHKVLERRARCFLALNDLKRAMENFKTALTSLDMAGLNVEAKQRKEHDFTIMISLMTKTLEKQGEHRREQRKSVLPAVPELTNGVNEQYPSASNSVGFCESENEGRFAIANGDIQAGEWGVGCRLFVYLFVWFQGM